MYVIVFSNKWLRFLTLRLSHHPWAIHRAGGSGWGSGWLSLAAHCWALRWSCPFWSWLCPAEAVAAQGPELGPEHSAACYCPDIPSTCLWRQLRASAMLVPCSGNTGAQKGPPNREICVRAWTTVEEHVYLARSNKLPHCHPPPCWFSGWNLSLTHCHWTCLGPKIYGWKPHRSGAVGTGLVSAGTNTNRCFHLCAGGSDWLCRRWRPALWGWWTGTVGSVSARYPHWILK